MRRPALLLVLGIFVVVVFLIGGSWSLTAEQPAPGDARKAAQKAQADGNFKDAFALFEKLCLDPANSTSQAADDLSRAVQCLARLQKLHEVDALLEKVAKVHADHWRVLAAVAQQYGSIEHNGYLIAGVFNRGYSNQGGAFVSSDEGDFVRGMQLFEASRKLAVDESNATDVGNFYRSYGHFIVSMQSGELWQLQVLTDLKTMPDYEPTARWGRGRRGGGADKGAPVDADGNPVF